MADMGWMGGNDAIDRWNFFRKSEEIMKYLHEIQKYFTKEEQNVVEQALEVISNLVQRKMNEKPSHISLPESAEEN
jgi:hypothetical protein